MRMKVGRTRGDERRTAQDRPPPRRVPACTSVCLACYRHYAVVITVDVCVSIAVFCVAARLRAGRVCVGGWRIEEGVLKGSWCEGSW